MQDAQVKRSLMFVAKRQEIVYLKQYRNCRNYGPYPGILVMLDALTRLSSSLLVKILCLERSIHNDFVTKMLIWHY